MIQGILIFIIFLGPLIFFHELGHFLMARFFGVRVEVFSIGFGPKILKYVRNGTEYAISIIPLGGYVKMFGDDPFSETPLTEEEKKVAFNHKSKWARFWIVFGGPLANLLLAYVLYVGLLSIGEKVPETKVGLVAEQSVLYQKGLRSGDVLIGINDEKILSFDDLNIKGSQIETIKVRRSNEELTFPINLGQENFIEEFVKLVSVMRRPVFVNTKGERHYLSLTKTPTNFEFSLEEINANFKGTAYLYSFTEENEQIVIDAASESEINTTPTKGLISTLIDLEYFPVDLVVRNVVMNSAADSVKMKKGDILIQIDDKKLFNFDDLRTYLQTIPDDKLVTLNYFSNGVLTKKEVKPELKEVNKAKVKLLGIESSIEFIPPKLILAKEENFLAAMSGAFTRTWDGIQKTVSGYKKLITREVSLNNIGGPLAIGKVASDSFNISLSMFFRLMAFISINLGVINLFPIPVLDGGHIMFLVFEAVNGGPLSRRKLEIAQRVGMSFLFALIFIALFNDVARLF